MDDHILTLWAKLPREPDRHTYHPLICHLIDVACVTEALWELGLTSGARQLLAHALGLREDEARCWLAFWAGLHDVGKAFPGFQIREQGSPIERAATRQVLAAGFPRGMPTVQPAPHGTVTACVLKSLLVEEFAHSPDLARAVAYAVGGHHGAFPTATDVLNVDPQVPSAGPWADARRQLAEPLAAVTGVSAISPPAGTLPTASATLLAGLVSVADWIGSIESPHFPHAAELGAQSRIDPAEYVAAARRQARQALDAIDWRAPPRQPPAGFAALFPGISEPNELQRLVDALADRLGDTHPALVVIEAPTGEGKTEAAWLLADRWAIAGAQRGVYVAMPTQATSDGLFGRVRTFLEHRYGATDDRSRVALQLLHGHASLSAEFAALRGQAGGLPEPNVGDETRPVGGAGAVIAGEWFTHRKRGLLAPFGVGTVDQALLGVLRVRHVFVRLFGLAARTVVIDEAHAYDTYMSTLLERLLEWLGALGTSVVVLSATLPSERRRRLAQAYARGLTGLHEPPAVPEAPYPRVTWVTATEAGAEHVAASSTGSRTIELEWISATSQDGDPAEILADRLRAALTGGGCAAVVCNTVRQAQDLYRALQPHFPGLADDGLPELDLLHARFRFLDRRERERRVLKRFGKPGGTVALPDGTVTPVRRPHRAVLVATQVIEQSLDLDFDLMGTYVAPVDLVLQRAGRLHRHRRTERPLRLTEPRLWLLAPELDEHGIPRFGSGTEWIYDRHLLLRTWLALRTRERIVVPDDVEGLIGLVYDERDWPGELSPGLRAELARTRAELDAQLAADENEAAKRWLRRPSHRGGLWELTRDLKEEDAPDFHASHQALTRLAEPSLTVVLLYGSPEFPRLEPGDEEALDLRLKPDLDRTRSLLERSVVVTGRRNVSLLQRETAVPTGWQQSPLLRNARPLFLDERGQCALDGGRWVARLDPELGLVIDAKEGTGAEL
ncbi:CRISPR-associated helicase Cas3' [Thermomicrobiaceae bacterium CFH 74404]|uniref:CRISPR-associated helicase Cas3 n=1 Tax=Thermalbibacter longus TaxID=2951981 RepID=A0AA42BA08_9BACT|nr:CRISPR-associated helicase Cas3' [Thermalbibacter longus]MCM8749102.1 CRISPR-associated helicase Cas3' [Thermalbibacter longus]